MSTNQGYILLKGNLLSDIDTILESFYYYPIATEKTSTFHEAKVKSIKKDGYAIGTDGFAIGLDKGWTIIFDLYSKTLQKDVSYVQWMEWSSVLATEIFAWETYSGITKDIFFYFSDGRIIRGFYNLDGELKVNIGEPFPIEKQLEKTQRDILDIYDEDFCVIHEFEVDEIMKSITGIDEKEMNNATDCMVKITEFDLILDREMHRREYGPRPKNWVWGESYRINK